MLIYTDEANSQFANMTPALAFKETTDFASILAEIEYGNIPSGTGQPFPVMDEETKKDDNLPPWIANNTNYSTNVQPDMNPWVGLR